jgi:diadenosine tetraphosphatase ApaH/serine/threonine PP2A family protein phosphatase
MTPRKRGKAVRIGERLIAAEVIERGKDGWVKLLVRACTIPKDESAGRPITLLKPGEALRRGEKTTLRGRPQRLLWDDETARQAVVNGSSRGSRYNKKDDDGE